MKHIDFSPEDIAIKMGSTAVLVKNNGKKKLAIDVKLAGSNAFVISDRYKTIEIKPSGYARIPFRFNAKRIGWPIALSAKHKTAVQIWQDDPKKKIKYLLKSTILEAISPLFVPALHCMATQPKRPFKRGNSPPVITMNAVKPGTGIPRNTETTELSWEISGADAIDDWISRPDLEVLEPGTVTGASGWECSCHVTLPADSYAYTPGSTITQTLWARNADGEEYEHETIYAKANIGYHNAKCPAGATIYSDELDKIRDLLEDIDENLRANALENLPSFIEEWNSSLDALVDIPPEVRERYRLPMFDDIDYLSGRVGTGSLADDLLAAMLDVLIYAKAYTLPRGFRPGTISEGEHSICEEYVCSEDGSMCTVMGKTAYYAAHPDCNWISICIEKGADSLTLLHELYHYCTGNGDEMKAVAISCCCFDFIAPDYW